MKNKSNSATEKNVSRKKRYKVISFRVDEETYSHLDRYAKKLKLPPTTLARELLENSLAGNYEDTLLTAFSDSESRIENRITSLANSVEHLNSMMVDHHENYANAMYVLLAFEKGSEEAREYMKKIFPLWSLE